MSTSPSIWIISGTIRRAEARNGSYSKWVLTDLSLVDLNVPRGPGGQSRAASLPTKPRRHPDETRPSRRQPDEVDRVIFHTDRGSAYTSTAFTRLCRQLGIRQSMGRVGSCFDNAAAEAFFSSLEWEVLSRYEFADPQQAQAVVLDWCYDFYNNHRRHSSAAMMSPINYENTAAAHLAAA